MRRVTLQRERRRRGARACALPQQLLLRTADLSILPGYCRGKVNPPPLPSPALRRMNISMPVALETCLVVSWSSVASCLSPPFCVAY